MTSVHTQNSKQYNVNIYRTVIIYEFFVAIVGIESSNMSLVLPGHNQIQIIEHLLYRLYNKYIFKREKRK